MKLRCAVSKLLRKEGFGVIEARDGSAAVDLLRSKKDEIHAILLGICRTLVMISLPGRPGMQPRIGRTIC